MAAQKKIPKRSEVDKQYTWATEDLFATDELWEKALEDAKKKYVGNDPHILALPKTFKVGAVHLCMADDDLSQV